MSLLLGAHQSIAGGYWRALQRTGKLACNSLQIFLKNQRQWRGRRITSEDLQQWSEFRQQVRPSAIVGHCTYLINLASADKHIWEQSIDCLSDELDRCRLLDIPALVIHPGCHVGSGEKAGLKRISKALKAVLAKTDVTILLETTAGQGTALGYKLEHLRYLIDHCDHGDRLGVCVDTCHVFAAGYGIDKTIGYKRFMRQLKDVIGLDKLGCVHVNDSLGKCGSRVDRHAHIGKGQIGLDCFRLIMKAPSLRNVPKIIETPKGEGLYADRRNIRLLRKLASGD